MPTKRSKRWNFSGEAKDYLDQLIATRPNWNATNIYKSLQKDMGDRPDLPVLRTVQSYVAWSRPPDPTGEWLPTGPGWSGDDAQLVLEALSEARCLVREAIPWPTQAEAERILWMRKMDLPPLLGWAVARFYLMREARQESTRGLDWFLAFKPWLSNQVQRIYLDAMEGAELERGIWYLLEMQRRFRQRVMRRRLRKRTKNQNHNIEAKGTKEEAND